MPIKLNCIRVMVISNIVSCIINISYVLILYMRNHCWNLIPAVGPVLNIMGF